jgi:hypothetical protein
MLKRLLATTALIGALVAPALAGEAQVCPQPTAILDAACNPVAVKTVTVRPEEMPTDWLPIPGGVYGGSLPVVQTSGTWATLAQLTGGPDGTPAGYGVGTLAAWPSVDETVGRP